MTEIKNNIILSTPLDGDKPKFSIHSITGTEVLSDLFTYKLTLSSKDDKIDFDKLLGKNVTVTIYNKNTKEYFIDGIVSKMMMAERNPLFTNYFIELKPWFWKLTLITDNKIFQNKKVTEIIAEVFSKNGFTDFDDRTTGTYSERVYCVQYRESSFNFVSRLMEDEGIFYFFEHKKGKHTLVLADDLDTYKNSADLAEAEIGNSFIRNCLVEQVITTNKYSVNDYNFETPDSKLLSLAGSPKGDTFQVYEYPAKYLESSQGDAISKKRLESFSFLKKMISGESTYRTFNAGYKFKLKNHQRSDLNAEYVLYKVTINVTQTEYGNSFEAFPSGTQFRPPIRAEKPRIYGTPDSIGCW